MPKEPVDIFSVWEGVYETFSEACGESDAFNDKSWLERQANRTREAVAALESKTLGTSKDYPLAAAVALVLAQKDFISILDFGGGMGLHYFDLLAKLPETTDKIFFTVVENSATVACVPKEVKKYSNLQLFSDLSQVQGKFDVVHMGSTLQYVDDWKSLVARCVISYAPAVFIFSDLLAGDIPDFVTHQLCYGKKIPSHFFNYENFKNHMQKTHGYKLIYESKFVHKILGQEDVYPNFALPESHRIDRGLNVIFYRP